MREAGKMREAANGEDGVALVRAAVAALNRGDIATYEAAFRPDCTRWMLGVAEPLSVATIGATLRELHQAFTGFALAEELLVGGDGHVVARWRTTGTHTGEFQGIAPTGRSISVQTCEIYALRDGAVAATWSYGDPLDLPRQLGVA
jgi:predicted ester cyclase